MNKLNVRIVLSVMLLALLTVAGCKIRPIDDISLSGLESEWAVPLIDTDKNFGDIINNFDPKALIQIAPDGGVVLRYKGVYTAKSSLDIFANFQNAFFQLTDTVMPIPLRLPSGVSIDSVKMKNGTLGWAFSASTEGSLNVKLRMPQLTKNGVPFETNFVVGNALVSNGIDLAGYELKPTGPAGDVIYVTHDARKANGDRVNLSGKALIVIKDFQAAFAKGYFGLSVFDSPRDTIKIDFFDQWKGGTVKFGNPKLIATLDNSFGVPVKAVMSIGQVTTIDGRLLQLTSPLAAGVDVNYPAITEIGKSKRTVVTFDKTNSNLAEIISANPTSIDYKLDGFLNADTAKKIVGFLTDSSKFNLQVELEVPMEGTAKDFGVNDTFPINLATAQEITKAEFKILTDNGMPIDVAIQGYFATEKGQILDSLYAQKTQILRGAPVGTNGLPTGSVSTENVIAIDAAKLNKIRDAAKKLIVRYNFSTTNAGAIPVKLAAKQGVRVRIGVKFGYKTK